MEKIDSSMRVIDILETLKENNKNGLGITDISNITGHSKSTVHRTMVALRERGYVTRDSTTKKYKLGHKLWQLTNNLIDNLDVRHIARPYMEKLNEKYKESVHLIVRSGNYGLYIDKIDSPLPIGLQVHIGKRILL